MNRILILLALCIIGCHAHFQCIYRLNKTSSGSSSGKSCHKKGRDNRPTTQTTTGEKMPKLEQMLELKGLLSLESLCFDMCNNCDGPGTYEHSDKFLEGLLHGVHDSPAQGVVGDVLDVASPLNCVAAYGLKVTRYQACTIMCMANLTVLDKCQVQAIAAKLQALCPNLEYKDVCVSACLCCGNATKSKDLCVELCIGRKQGEGQPQLPVVGDLPAKNLLKQGTLSGIAGKQGLPGVGLNLDSKSRDNKAEGGNVAGSGSSGTGGGSGGASGEANVAASSGESGSSKGASGGVGGLTDVVGGLTGGLGGGLGAGKRRR